MCVCAVDMDDSLKDEAESSTSLLTGVHGSTDDDLDARPPYHHVDKLTSRPPTDQAAVSDDGSDPGRADQASTDAVPVSPLPSRRAGQRQQRPRSTTKCRMVPLVVSGQATARFGQLCFETTDPRPWRHPPRHARRHRESQRRPSCADLRFYRATHLHRSV